MHSAACKTILRLRENPKHFKLAVNAGIAHELGHLILQHQSRIDRALSEMNRYKGKWQFFNPKKWISILNYFKVVKACEREADKFATTSLQDGLKGIEVGFRTWQASLLELRHSTQLDWKNRLLMKLLISPWGNPLTLYFTHGSFDQRIAWAREDHISKAKKTEY